MRFIIIKLELLIINLTVKVKESQALKKSSERISIQNIEGIYLWVGIT
jgi:hypothetical protein